MIAELTPTPAPSDALPAMAAAPAATATGSGDFAAALARAVLPQAAPQGAAALARPAMDNPATDLPADAPPCAAAILSRLAPVAAPMVAPVAAPAPPAGPTAAATDLADGAPVEPVTAESPVAGSKPPTPTEAEAAQDSAVDAGPDDAASPTAPATLPQPLLPPTLPVVTPSAGPVTDVRPKADPTAPATLAEGPPAKGAPRGARLAAPHAPVAPEPACEPAGADRQTPFPAPVPPPAPAPADAQTALPAAAAPEAMSQTPATPTPVPQTAGPRQMPLDTRLPDWEARLADGLALRLDGTGQEIELLIQPEHLGPIEIHIAMEERAAQVRIVTDNPQAAQLFQQAEPRLAEALSRAGLSLAQHDAQMRNGRDPRNRPRGAEGMTGTLPAAPPAALSTLRRQNGLLNIVA